MMMLHDYDRPKAEKQPKLGPDPAVYMRLTYANAVLRALSEHGTHLFAEGGQVGCIGVTLSARGFYRHPSAGPIPLSMTGVDYRYTHSDTVPKAVSRFLGDVFTYVMTGQKLPDDRIVPAGSNSHTYGYTDDDRAAVLCAIRHVPIRERSPR